MENTLGNTRKYIDHWIKSLLLWNIRQLHYTRTIAQEFAIKKAVHQVHLHYNIHETQKLAQPVTNGVQFMTLKCNNLLKGKEPKNQKQTQFTFNSPWYVYSSNPRVLLFWQISPLENKWWYLDPWQWCALSHLQNVPKEILECSKQLP